MRKTKLSNKAIVTLIKKLGYGVSFTKHGTYLKETWVSQIDGEKRINSPCYTTKQRAYDFLREVVAEKTIKGL